jgi:3-methyladenine DNA glycosylase AlkD
MTILDDNPVAQALLTHANNAHAERFTHFFKPGQHNNLLGVKMPVQKKVAKEFINIDYVFLGELLESFVHEHRMTAILILIARFEKQKKMQQEIYEFICKYLDYINTWDLVDTVSAKIFGAYLFQKDRTFLYHCMNSGNLWRQRLAIVATQFFIAQKDYKDTLVFSEVIIRGKNTEDLLHKACGWMLREIGDENGEILRDFLRLHAGTMPRTMLRYAIEKMSEKERKSWLKC